jgi:hypothetical protein
MASAIEDVQGLPGETVCDQDGLKIGKIKQLYSAGDGDSVMWVTVETSLGVGNKRLLFIPLARLKHERDELRVPYSTQHVQSSPEVEAGEQLSEGDDQALRAFYSISLGDQEVRTDNDSYAGQVPDGDGPAEQIDAEQARAPERDTGQGAERMRAENSRDEGADKTRKATADDVMSDG